MTDPARTTKEELLPCPFCGGGAYRDHDPGYGWWTTECNDCPCLMTEGGIHSEAEADAAWNKRADAADALRAQVAALQEERDQLEHRLNRATDIQTLRASLAATKAELAAAQAKLAVRVPEDVQTKIADLRRYAKPERPAEWAAVLDCADMLESLARDNAALRARAEALERDAEAYRAYMKIGEADMRRHDAAMKDRT